MTLKKLHYTESMNIDLEAFMEFVIEEYPEVLETYMDDAETTKAFELV